MAKKPLPLPSASASPVTSGASYDPLFYSFLASLLGAVNELNAATTMITSSGAPVAADIPDGGVRLWKNTGAGTVRLYSNDAGTLRSVLLT